MAHYYRFSTRGSGIIPDRRYEARVGARSIDLHRVYFGRAYRWPQVTVTKTQIEKLLKERNGIVTCWNASVVGRHVIVGCQRVTLVVVRKLLDMIEKSK